MPKRPLPHTEPLLKKTRKNPQGGKACPQVGNAHLAQSLKKSGSVFVFVALLISFCTAYIVKNYDSSDEKQQTDQPVNITAKATLSSNVELTTQHPMKTFALKFDVDWMDKFHNITAENGGNPTDILDKSGQRIKDFPQKHQFPITIVFDNNFTRSPNTDTNKARHRPASLRGRGGTFEATEDNKAFAVGESQDKNSFAMPISDSEKLDVTHGTPWQGAMDVSETRCDEACLTWKVACKVQRIWHKEGLPGLARALGYEVLDLLAETCLKLIVGGFVLVVWKLCCPKWMRDYFCALFSDQKARQDVQPLRDGGSSGGCAQPVASGPNQVILERESTSS